MTGRRFGKVESRPGKEEPVRTPLSVADDQNAHLFVIVQIGQKLRGQEEELAGFRAGSRGDQLIVDLSFGPLIHPLIDSAMDKEQAEEGRHRRDA